jgi:hypothetical protein
MPWRGSSRSKKVTPDALAPEGADEVGAVGDQGLVGAAREGVEEVVDRGEGQVGAQHPAPGLAQAVEGHGRQLMLEAAVDVQQEGVVAEVPHHMVGPDLLEQGAGR